MPDCVDRAGYGQIHTLGAQACSSVPRASAGSAAIRERIDKSSSDSITLRDYQAHSGQMNPTDKSFTQEFQAVIEFTRVTVSTSARTYEMTGPRGECWC